MSKRVVTTESFKHLAYLVRVLLLETGATEEQAIVMSKKIVNTVTKNAEWIE